MTTNKVENANAPAAAPPTQPPAAQGSSVRLFVLLGLLALAIGAYAYDYLVARPGVKAADEKIQAFVDARNKLGVKEASSVTPADVHKELAMKPTFVQKHAADNYEVEYYCWWGNVPVFNTRRHFISVVYLGQEPRRFSSHHLNEIPPDEALPIAQQSAKDDGQVLPQPGSPGDAPAEGKTEPDVAKVAAPDPPPQKVDEK